MSKFCQTCGKPLDDAVQFCDGCGAPQQVASQQPQQAPVSIAPEAPKKASFDFNKIVDEIKTFANGLVNRCKADKKFMFTCIGIAAAVVVVLVVLLSLIFSGGSYNSTINNAIDVFYNGKVSKLEKLAPKEYFEWYEDEYDTDVDEMIEEMEDQYDELVESLEEEYGDNYKVKYKVTKEKALSDRKLEGISEALADEYDINEKNVTAGYELDVDISIEGSEDDNDDEIEITVIKYKGSWYIIDWEKSGSDYYADFDPSNIMVWSFIY